jgi:hypothetical protein
MGAIIHAISAVAVKSRTLGSRLWHSLREPRRAPVPVEADDRPRRPRTHANFAIFR